MVCFIIILASLEKGLILECHPGFMFESAKDVWKIKFWLTSPTKFV